MVSFSSVASAIEFAVAFLTTSVFKARDEDVLLVDNLKRVKSCNGDVVVSGSLLKMGICSGIPSRVQACIKTGRMEYSGNIMVRLSSAFN